MHAIDSVRSSLLALEDLAKNLGLELQDPALRGSSVVADQNRPQSETDNVAITGGGLRRLQMHLGSEEPISHEEALGILQGLRQVSPLDLGSAHGHLDPARVAALLGQED